uniref:Uncharacterized protein n=1 Tax=Glossina palpalis gambiensis TaxID=67801 RepID=A0A1B0B0K6_9MUSC
MGTNINHKMLQYIWLRLDDDTVSNYFDIYGDLPKGVDLVKIYPMIMNFAICFRLLQILPVLMVMTKHKVAFQNLKTPLFSREYQAAQDCTCDNEHMFDCGGHDKGIPI